MNLLSLVFKILPLNPVYAHCDIPCGIYDPHTAQVAAHTVLRMTKMLQEVGNVEAAKVSRLVRVKEEHAEIVKNEVAIIWGDFFKPEHLEKFPELHTQVWQIMKAASKAKQEGQVADAEDLLDKVQKFAETFYQAKGLEPMRIPSGFPTAGEIVTHK